MADHMRERLYQAYTSGNISGWDDELPPLILHYLVHTRRSRTDRIRGRPLPPHPPKVYRGSKRCPECKKVVPGGRTAVCPGCDYKFSVKVVNPSLGNIARVMGLYDKLAGRWKVQAWQHGHAEDVLVRLYGDEGMIGHYTSRLHEEGDTVQVLEGDVWTDAVVMEATVDRYVLLCGARRSTDRSSWSGRRVTVTKSKVRNTPDTPSNSWFRLQKCPRSVTGLLGGRRKRTRRGGRGKGSTGHPFEYQWNLHAESTEDRLVWTGGGFGPGVKIIWLRDTTSRTAATTVYAVPGLIKRLPKKIICRADRKREHCACGDKTCNDLARAVPVILKSQCSFVPPTRRITANSMSKLADNSRSQVLRQQKLHDKIMSWRKSNHTEGSLPKRARFNELHYSTKFLKAMQQLGKKAIPRRISIEYAKQCDMFHPSLVVGDSVVTVPTLSTALARARRTTIPSVPLVDTPVITTPTVKRPGGKQSALSTRKRVRLSARAQRAQARTLPRMKPNESTRNILVVGLVAHLKEYVVDYTMMRDQCRIDALKSEFDTVFAAAKETEFPDPAVCVECVLNYRGAPKLVALMKSPRHAGKKLHHICLEYVRMPNWYYRNMILDTSPSPEQTMCAFIDTLRQADLLAPNCIIQFARMDIDARWSKAIKGLETRYGETNVEYVSASKNPLVGAAAATEGTYYDPHPYTHEQEISRLTQNAELPFVQLTIPALATTDSGSEPPPSPTTSRTPVATTMFASPTPAVSRSTEASPAPVSSTTPLPAAAPATMTPKFNLTKNTMSRKTCQMLYGFPMDFKELSYYITAVCFPGLKVSRSKMELNTPLKQFERALATLQFFKSGDTVVEVAHHWGVESRTMGRYLEEWSQKWEEAAITLCLLDPKELFQKSQPCEVVYSRVKKFRILKGVCPVNRCQYLNAAWMVAHMAANMYKPLAVPDSMVTWSTDKLMSMYYEYAY